jgi:glycosyltransferase involved in cell wall biosynthesis
MAVETIRRQDCPEWEIVISDNASEEDIAGWVRSLDDDRVLYARTAEFLPVTENWNAALARSSGDYVVMMGDDDGLRPGYIERMHELVERFDRPDIVYSGALLFTYPGVDPEQPEGELKVWTYADFFDGESEPFLVSRERRLAAVRRVMGLRLAYHFNMQLSLVSRSLIERVQRHGTFFQSPFPDYYATTAAFLEADRAVADPRPNVVIGVTPKSYGFFHQNKREQEGRALLEAHAGSPTLPGSNINDGWLGAIEAIQAAYGPDHGLRVNRRRYRALQASNVYTRHYRGEATADEVSKLEAGLPVPERFLYPTAYGVLRVLRRVTPGRVWFPLATRLAPKQFPERAAGRSASQHANMISVFEDDRRSGIELED